MSSRKSAPPSTILGEFSAERFLSEIFQKKALFLPGAVPGFQSPISADELAGLACEAEVEARLIEDANPQLASTVKPWRLSHGPFEEEVFSRLAPENWTLLVQDVDKWVPEVAQLLSLVDFLPSWSVDDIMISYAAVGGSVGPHVDQYDVFLLQAEGTRRWRLGPSHPDAALRSDTELKVLRDFQSQEEYLAEPGDVLYIPPGLAHFGEAETECLTYSFGFRAPSAASLLSALGDALVAQAEDLRLQEALTRPPKHPAELSAGLLESVEQLVLRAINQTTQGQEWLGRHLSEAKENLPLDAPDDQFTLADLAERLAQGAQLSRSPAARFLFSQEASLVTLFVAGEAYALDGIEESRQFAALVCGRTPLNKTTLAPWIDSNGGKVLLELHERGALLLD